MTARHALCRSCKHPVVTIVDQEGALLVLDPHESALGPGRYAIYDDGTVHPVGAGREVLAYPLHQCPDSR